MGEALEVTWDIEVEALDVPVPQRIVQAVVDAALRPGAPAFPQVARLRIGARLVGSDLELEVASTACQADDAEALAQLEHARQRLVQRYGESASIDR